MKSQVGEGGAAGEDVSTVRLAVGRSGDLRVIGRDEVVWEEEKGGSGVGDSGDAFADCASGADGVSAAREAPESLGVVHGGVGDVAGILARVNVAKVVAAGLALPQVGGEEGGVEAGLGVGEEGLGLVGLDGVDRTEGEAEETIALILSEFGADGLGQFDDLTGHGCTANIDGVGVDVATGRAAISIADAPGLAIADFRGRGLGGVVDAVASLLVGRQLG